MIPFTWRQWLRNLARRAPARPSTRLLDVERLEDRLVPSAVAVKVLATANIYVTGNVTNSIVSTDPDRFNDGKVAQLTHLSGINYLATNLRSAVAEAQTLARSSTIFLDTGTYELTGAEMEIQFGPMTALRITNDNGGVSTIDASDSGSRIFQVDSGGATTLDHLELLHGTAPQIALAPGIAGLVTDGASGGAILDYGNLTLTNDQLDDNSATGLGLGGIGEDASGGALFDASASPLTIKNCTFDSNVAQGGDLNFILPEGADNQAVDQAENQAGNGSGGAISAAAGAGPIAISACTFSNNQALGGANFIISEGGGDAGSAYGGAIALPQSPTFLKIVDSTFADNSAAGGDTVKIIPLNLEQTAAADFPVSSAGKAYGGAISASNQNTYDLVNDTIAFNQVVAGAGTNGSADGGGIANFGGNNTVNLVNTLIAQNTAGAVSNDLYGTYHTLGHNFIGNADGASFNGPAAVQRTDLRGSLSGPSGVLNPGLDPGGLQNNGGPTQTIALSVTSLAINSGDNAFGGLGTLTTDQRGVGFSRKVDTRVDIGAFEFQMNLNRTLTFQSNAKNAVSIAAPPPGLLSGDSGFPLGEGQSYQVALSGSPPAGIQSLVVNPDGSFSFTIPANYHGTVQFAFALLVASGEGDKKLLTPTQLIFTATITITRSTHGGRDFAYSN